MKMFAHFSYWKKNDKEDDYSQTNINWVYYSNIYELIVIYD